MNEAVGRVDLAVERFASLAVRHLERALGLGNLPILTGLSRPAIGDLARRAAAHPVSRDLARIVRERGQRCSG